MTRSELAAWGAYLARCVSEAPGELRGAAPEAIVIVLLDESAATAGGEQRVLIGVEPASLAPRAVIRALAIAASAHAHGNGVALAACDDGDVDVVFRRRRPVPSRRRAGRR